MEIFDSFHNLPCVVADRWLIVLEGPPLLFQESRKTSWEGGGEEGGDRRGGGRRGEWEIGEGKRGKMKQE